MLHISKREPIEWLQDHLRILLLRKQCLALARFSKNRIRLALKAEGRNKIRSFAFFWTDMSISKMQARNGQIWLVRSEFKAGKVKIPMLALKFKIKGKYVPDLG